jgi:hypothetical protein
MSRELGRRVAAAMMARHRLAVSGAFPSPGTACEAGSRPHGIAGCGCCAARRRRAQPMANRSPDLSRRHRNLIRHSNAARRYDERGTGAPNDVLIAAGGDIAAIVPPSARGVGESSRAAEAIEYGATRQAWGHSVSAPKRAAMSLSAQVDSGPPDRFSCGPVNVPIARDLDHTRQLRPAAFIGGEADRCLIRGRRINDAIWRSERKFAQIGYLPTATRYLMAPNQIRDRYTQSASGLSRRHKAGSDRPVGSVAAVDITTESCWHFEQSAARREGRAT